MTDNRLLLVNPPFPRKVAGFPLQMLYLASAVRDANISVDVLDLDIEPDEQRESILEQKLREYMPTHVGVTAYSPNYPESLDIMRQVKEINPRVIVISGGPHQIAVGAITQRPEFIDHIVTDTFGQNKLLKFLGSNFVVKDIAGLFPAFDLLKQSKQYSFDSGLFNGETMTQLFSATGCSQGCNFCSAQIGYNPLPNLNVIQQLEKLVGIGYRAIFFNDPNFTDTSKKNLEDRSTQNGQYQRVINLMDEFIKAGIPDKLKCGCQTKASLVTPQVLEKMAQAGCRYITYSLETVNEEALRAMKKGLLPNKVQNAVETTKKLGMKVGLYVMLGSYQDDKGTFIPEVDLETTSSTLDFVEKNLRPNYLSISILANYPMFDRIRHGQRLHMHLDYANQRYSRDPIWLNFDEGWGAFHPTVNEEHAQKYLKQLEIRKAEKPHIWNPDIAGAIRRF